MSSLQVDLKDPRIPGGRLSVQAGTSDPALRDAYRRSIRALLGQPMAAAVIARLRLGRGDTRKLTPAEVHQAVTALDLSPLCDPPLPLAEAGAEGGVRPAMLGEIVDRYLLRVGSDNAPQSAKAYASLCRRIERDFGVVREPGRRGRPGKITADRAVRSISEAEGEAWLKSAKPTNGNRPWSPSQQNAAHGVCGRLFAMALSQEEDEAARTGAAWRPWRNFWRRDPNRSSVRAARKKRSAKPRPRTLTRQQVAAVLRMAKDSPRAAWVAVGYYAGLRKQEAANLRTGVDIDLARLAMHVVPRGGRYPWATKTDNSIRSIDISSPLARWLRRHVALGFAGAEYFFRLPGADRPLGELSAIRWTREAYEAGGLPYGRQSGLTHHALRHSLATALANKGWSPKVIADILGNTPKQVMETYLHAYPSDRRAAMESLRRKGAER